MKQAISISVKEKNDIPQYSLKWKNNPIGEEMSCKSFEYPRPELLTALGDLKEFVPMICGIPQEAIRRIKVAGATFEYNKSGKLSGLIIDVWMLMRNERALEFKTPEQSLRVDNPDLEQSSMWEDRLTKQALVLHDEIIMYAEGKRGQTVLDFEREGNEHGQYGEESSAEAGEESE